MQNANINYKSNIIPCLDFRLVHLNGDKRELNFTKSALLTEAYNLYDCKAIVKQNLQSEPE